MLLEVAHEAGVDADAILSALDSRFSAVRAEAEKFREQLDDHGRSELRRTLLAHANRYPSATLRLVEEEIARRPSPPDAWQVLVAALTTAQIAALNAGSIAGFTSQQLAALSTAQAEALTSAQVGILNSDQIHQLGTDDIATFSPKDIGMISASAVGVMISRMRYRSMRRMRPFNYLRDFA